MIDFRLQVFYTVAKRLNFTKAAKELFISQPAVTRHIKELEYKFKLSLFERSGNKKIMLTTAGEILKQYVEQVLNISRELEFDMNLLAKQNKGILHIGASTTVAQYVIPAVLAQFHQKFKEIQIQLKMGNTEDIEQALLCREIEFGIIEGISRNPQISYEKYFTDEIVLVCSKNNTLVKKDTIKPEEIKNYPLVLREPGSGTLDVIIHALKLQQIKLTDLNIEMQLGGTESIKSYLLQSNCLAFLSIQSILKELKNNECRIIDIKGLTIERAFHFIQLHGQPDSLSTLFMRFAKAYNGYSGVSA